MSFMGNMAGNKAVQAHRKGQYKEAEKLYREALAKGMDNPAMLLNFVTLLVRHGEYDEGLDVIRRLEKAGKLTEHTRVDMHVQYAIILWKRGHLDHAIEILEEDLRHVKTGALYSVIGYLKIEQGNAEEAERFAREALEYDEEDAIFQDNMGQVLYRLKKDPTGARPYFDRAISLRPESIDTNYFLAQYAMQEGDAQKARNYLETAAKGRTSPLNYASPERIQEALSQVGQF